MRDPGQEQAAISGRGWGFVLLFTAIGGALRLADLGGAPLWLDENATFLSIRHLWDAGSEAPIFVQASNPLYYLLLWCWTQLAGESAFALRSLSAVAGTACIPLAAGLARRLAGPTAARIAAVLVALHPLHVHYSREARAYALWTLALLAATAALWGACVRGGRWRWSLAAVAWLAAFGSHVFTAFALLPSAACALWAADPRRARRHWRVWAALLAATMGLYGASVLWPVLAAGPGTWLRADSWQPLGSLFASIWALLPAGAYPGHLAALAPSGHGAAAAQALTLVAATLPLAVVPLALASLPRHRVAERAERDWRPLAALAIGPLALEWFTSWVQPVFLAGRYDLVSWGATTLWIALGVASLGVRFAPPARRRVQWGATLLLALCAAVPVARLLHSDGKAGWDQARAQRLAELAGAGDLVITFSNDDDAMAHALSRAGFAAELRPFPGWLGRQIAFTHSERDLSPERATARARDAAALLRETRQALASGGQVFWLGDALRLDGRGARAVLPATLESELRAAGFERQPVDEPLAIDRLVPRGPPPRSAPRAR